MSRLEGLSSCWVTPALHNIFNTTITLDHIVLLQRGVEDKFGPQGNSCAVILQASIVTMRP